MEYYNFEGEEKFLGKIKEEIHGDKKFLLKQALRYVVDVTDDYGYNVEQSHYEPLNYYIVSDYMPLDNDTDVLDLTWMDSGDSFCFQNNNDTNFSNIKKIIVNIDNLLCSNIMEFELVDIIIKNSNSHINYLTQIKYLNNFFDNNLNLKHINSIKFEGFNPKMEKVLYKYIKKCYDNYNETHDKKELIYIQ